jgi:hypothetical protein
MKHIILFATLMSLASPTVGQEDSMQDLLKRFETLSEQGQNLLESWADEVGPKLDELGPILEGLVEKLGDINAYHAPEFLENGDIIIRRKKPVNPEPEAAPETAAPMGKPTIDL